ncbi:MAG: phosphoribosylamine--glycine ligase [Candidatus Omnitrophica bacterium]|nr:phosphoribosylamine--glycine ligase [Candidatus Omnitrophota bacterium]
MKVLVIGSGGREHCLVWKIFQSLLVDKIYCAPGNGGTFEIAENVNISAEDIDSLLEFALKEDVDLTVVGPEIPLVLGIVDRFEEKGLKIFGPKKELALLEGSKVYSKEVMRKYGVPTADFRIFTEAEEAKQYVSQKGLPLVIKADGLAAGKGVIICESQDEAFKAIDSIIVDKQFGDAGNKIIIEDLVDGEEVSVLIFTDGNTILPLVSSQDHKRAFDGDNGPNTGGMGAYSPAPLVSEESFNQIIKKAFKPLIEGLRKEGKVYKGILYGGLMIKNNQPYVLEYNVRLGDPETQAILPKLKSDLVEVMLNTINESLSDTVLEWDDRFCLSVVLTSGGYPGHYEKGNQIFGLEELKNMKDIYVFHAGTKTLDNKIVTNGGRVLNIVSIGANIKEAQEKVYQAIKIITFDKMFYRKDIGYRALQRVNL